MRGEHGGKGGRPSGMPNDGGPDGVLMFSRVKPRRVFEEICEQIRRELESGALKPGDKLPPERDLAQQFGVSRTAVREALRSLENAGIVGLHKGTKGGAFILEGNADVVTQSLRDMMSVGSISLDSLTEARVLILTEVVRLACKRATEVDMAAISTNIDRLAELTDAGRIAERAPYSFEFYSLLARATRNGVLMLIIDSISRILLQFVVRVGPLEALDLVGSRRRFLRHLRNRDADRAVKEITTHLKGVHRVLLQYEKEKTAAGATQQRG